ncbi:hypothetical protein M441DRAFT_58525 [Trichoderma asperellum CBS 433.97]|uniref:Heterokaryon incompatibility domain-containing protein n=1 Tax=Trichoderma asperellum (strain ATCC 204424 / CBS 433.97 / NBRC 101777) TaxID=1042311 RepID=A0A2T3Z8F2_TRIA4|nr:hypothetical protein M441DRAFT_58525 [Trichoderma asperellum CBS 433.97]PTB41087.1 hypothetical protein M441DRAFT_58525 [Trichoderma asperellum CBS 433.97]
MVGQDGCLCLRPDIRHINGVTTCLSCGYTTFILERKCTDSLDNMQSLSVLAKSNVRFRYTQLQFDDSIRLIRLYAGDRKEAIQCEIFHSSLHDHPEFEGLSYAWGGSTLSEKIYSTVGSLEVTTNCAAALRDLRYKFHDRVLWIDAICIDQSNILEKNKQIPLMSKIYSEARQVVVHLGAETRPNVDLFFEFLQQNGSSTGRQVTQVGISAFLSRPWFSRVWVLQEVAVARKILVMWGSTELRWEFLSTARLSTLGLMPVDETGKIPPVLQLSQGIKKPLKDFPSLIHTARSCASTDPRDKIYALLGLLSDQVVHKMIPDYNKPVKDLYIEVTMHIINLYNHLDILSFIGRHTTEEISAISAFKTRSSVLWENRIESAAKTAVEAQKQAEHIRTRVFEAKDAENQAWNELREKEVQWKRWKEKSQEWRGLECQADIWRELTERGRAWRQLKGQQRGSPQNVAGGDQKLCHELRENEVAMHKLREEQERIWDYSERKELKRQKELRSMLGAKQRSWNAKADILRCELELKNKIFYDFEAKKRIWPEIKEEASRAWREVEDVRKEWEEWRKKTEKAEAEYREKALLLEKQIMQRRQARGALKSLEEVGLKLKDDEEQAWHALKTKQQTGGRGRREANTWRKLSAKEENAWHRWQWAQEQARIGVERDKERAWKELKEAKTAWLEISSTATDLEAAKDVVAAARNIWEEAHDAVAKAEQHPLIQAADLAMREYRALENGRSSSLFDLNRHISRELRSQTRFIQRGQQPLPSWVLHLDGHPCLASLSAFQIGSKASIFQQPVARLCRSGHPEASPVLEIKILELDTVAQTTQRPTSKPRRADIPVSGISESQVWQPELDFMSRFNHGPRMRIHGSSFHSTQQFCQGRRLVKTKRSWVICTGQVEDGDKICAVYGASVPFLLRLAPDRERRFKLIGECYLDGFRGPKFVDDYLELLGEYKRYFNVTTARSLPWQMAYLE